MTSREYPSRPHGKGRPTPKRREAEAANRRPLVAGSTKGKSPEEKRKIREQRAKIREGMMRGEEKYLHERDRGPERRFLRDAVDRRWNIGEILLPVMILTGLAMSPAMDAAWPWLLDIFGGRQSARSIHFIAMVALVLFIIVHLALVILAGAWNEVRSMITGRFTVPGHVPAHTGEDAA